ncbi:MAG: HDOD domain-containing protein [Woeseiaceae bacterium]
MTAETQTSDTAANLAKSIMALPPLPATAQEILTCFGDEFIDAEQVASVVEGDAGICAKLLGLANSAYFGLSEPVNDMEQAISRVLGVDTVRSLVLAMAIQQSFSSKKCPAFDVERFWLMSLMTAECCKKIAAADDLGEGAERDLAYSAGLCHNLGLMALTHIEADRSCQVLMHNDEQVQHGSLTQWFQEEFNTDHRIMTAELARLWSLPAPMVAAYHYRAFPTTPCEDRLGLVVSVGTAAVQNAALPEDRHLDIAPWSELLGIAAEDIQSMAEIGERQKSRVQSLAGRLTH